MKKSSKIIGHLFFWSCFLLMISFFVWLFFNNLLTIKDDDASFLDTILDKDYATFSSIIVLIGAFGFYTSYYIITPKIIRKDKRIELVFWVLLILIIPALLLYLSSTFFPFIDWLSLYVVYPILFIFSFVGALWQTWSYGRKKEQENAILTKEHLETQLILLKNQINPHFLFNTINNIDVLIEHDAKTASSYLRKLGDLLRFMLYRVDAADMIPLNDEIEYLKKYIDLQRIRSVNPNFVQFKISGPTETIAIAPMILVVFVENAFKYVGNKQQDNAIELELRVLSSHIFFRSRNTQKSKKEENDTENGGIGLTSVEKRLSLIYKDNYELNIDSDDDYFEVKLHINHS
ncbi:MAG: sensor histidine kinase [Bacteroidota bacterium]